MDVYRDKFINISYEEQRQLIRVKWSPETMHLNEESFKACLTQWRDFVVKKKYPVFQTLVNSKEFKFTIVPEVQGWVSENVTKPCINAGLQRIGFLVSEELFSQVSIEQTMEETTAVREKFEVKYFLGEKEIEQWLLG